MKKIIPILIVLAALVIGWFIISPGGTFDYVATVDQEVAALETELAQLDIAVTSGALTPEKATDAKAKILTRLNTINDSVGSSDSIKLTLTERQQFTDGLNRLKTILINYQKTLSVIDETAVSTAENHTEDKLSLIIVDTIDTVEDAAQEVIDDYTPDEVLDEQVEAVIEEASPTEELPEELGETSTSTETEVGTETTSSEKTTSTDTPVDETTSDTGETPAPVTDEEILQ